MAKSNVFTLDQMGNYRKPGPEPLRGSDVVITTDNPDLPQFDAVDGTTQVPLEDGNLVVAFGPPTPARRDSEDFDENLAEHLSDSELTSISEKLLMGIEQDESSRAEWLENFASGISLLGLQQIKGPKGAAAASSTPSEGTSSVDSPLLLEACLRFQANAYGELLPSDGPVKVRNDGEGNATADRLASALEKDLNHYLTKVAKEYYPDTDRMLLLLGFGGIAFKKGYHCPIRRRPVIESINVKDLIVSNAATDIEGAGRVTHRISMRPSVLRRMQLLGAYRDVPLPTPDLNPIKNPVDAKIDQIQGIAAPAYVEPLDQDRELYECYCELEIPGFEHEDEHGEATGLPLPFKVTLDKSARRVLEIRRNWPEDDELCLPRNRFVAYVFVPGLGFYGIGLLNILGNSTKAVTAAWRLMIDAGMYANFPGFLYLKSLGRQMTNQFRVPPGGGMAIDTVGNDIRASVMPLPYKDPSAVFIQLMNGIMEQAQRVGGTAELQIGEGKQDAPVGTTLALIEQATKLMSAVHKRMHQAQGQEFDMLRKLLMEDPEALWRHNKKSAVLKQLAVEAGQGPVLDQEDQAEDRHRELFLAALADLQLVPAADPNTSSQTERYLKAQALRMLAQTNPQIDLNKVDERALRIMGIDDPESLFKPMPPPGAQSPAPEAITAQATMMAARARMTDSQTRMAEAQAKAQDSKIQGAAKLQSIQAQTAAKAQDLASRERIASLGIAREMIIHNDDQRLEQQRMALAAHGSAADRAADIHSTVADLHDRAAERVHKFQLTHLGHAATAQNALAEHGGGMVTRGLELRHEAHQNALDRDHEAALAKAQPKGVAEK